MEPTAFTKTSFCSTEIDNITKNEAKQYILNKLSILCSGIKYNSRYAKVYNDQFSKNLNNPHIYCLKSSGTPYLLFLSKINGVNYCFLIDKKIKEGYDYPKIFIPPYHFPPEYFKGTLFECELIRNKVKKWSLAINDVYCCKGTSLKKTIIMDRINIIHKCLQNDYQTNDFSNICPIFVKKFFDYKDIDEAIQVFAPNLPYNVRGIYFVPLRTDYSNILYLFPKDHSNPVPKPVEQIKTTKCFRIMKTMKPDVYELYLQENDNLMKQGIALVQTTVLSHTLHGYFEDRNFDDEILIECRFNERFKKWEPVSLSEGPIDSV